MEYIIVILAVAIISAILYFSIARKHNTPNASENAEETNNNNNEETNAETQDDSTQHTANKDYNGLKTRELCKALLRDLNCNVVEDEEDNERMEFVFQGEAFCIIASDDCLLATVYDFSWGSISLDDIDDVARLRKVINNVNFRFGGLAVVYTINTEKNNMVVHTKRQFLVTPEIPNILNYIEAMLTGFFEVQRALTHELDRMRMESEKKK